MDNSEFYALFGDEVIITTFRTGSTTAFRGEVSAASQNLGAAGMCISTPTQTADLPDILRARRPMWKVSSYSWRH